MSTSYDKMTEGSRAVKISVHMLPETMLELKLSALHTDSATSRRSYFAFSFFLAVFEGNSYRYLEAEREIPHKCEVGVNGTTDLVITLYNSVFALGCVTVAYFMLEIYPYSRLHAYT